jgi:Zn-dependent metalloprotease
MRKFSALLLLFFALANAFGQYNSLGQFTGSQANNLVPGAEVVWLKHYNILPAFVQYRDNAAPDVPYFLAYMQKKFRLPSAYSFLPTQVENDPEGWRHVKYQMLVNGVPVLNGIFVLHLWNEKVKKFNGYVFNNIYVATTPDVNESIALNAAIADVGATTYKWQLPGEEEFLKQESKNPQATFFPKGELMIIQLGDNSSDSFRLTWRFDVYAHEPMSRWYVYVDAQEGRVLRKDSRICTADTAGTAVTAYRGSRSIVADSYNNVFRLRETTRGLGIRTFNMQKGTSYGNAVDFTDADNFWNNVNTNKDQYATDAHWGAEMTYDFYQLNGRNSIDGNGYMLNLYVHYNNNYVNAFWDGTRMTFGDGNANYNPLTSLDVTGHEISHGLDEHTANLAYQGESGALNESFSDIFGTSVEHFADSTNFNWLIGEDLGAPFRSMSNPNAYGDPDTYFGNNWYSGTGDYGGVHTNSGVQNYWFYLLSMGGTGTNDIGNNYNVTGIGIQKAQQIAWRNMVYYLTNSSDYADARFYSIQAANDLFGACSPEAISTTKAWYAVGVGSNFVFGTTAQFSLSPNTGCTVPATISFNNLSNNANSFVWYFGDGTTSTLASPAHTYNNYGNYNVKLVANGGICGTDSVTLTNAVSLQPGNPCIVILPKTGTYQTQTACAGMVYDNGGPGDSYSDNSNSIVTIAPPGAATVTLHFTQFKMEQDYDYLYVYDGPNTSGTVLGTFTGSTLPANITSISPSVTIRQFSDVSVVDSGFAIQWSCNQPIAAPVAKFKADATTSCSGVIKFTDQTTGGVNSWLWNFGDGTTSTQQHPAHTYTASGTYTVTLTATNNFGSNTSIKTNYITINRPAAPSVQADSACGSSSFTVSVNSSDSIRWYNANNTLVYEGNPFTTGIINSTSTYYAEQVITQPSFYVGPANNTIGSGNNYNTNQTRALRFKVFKNCQLVSVLVYAQGDGYRTIQYRDSVGAVITEKTVFIPNGNSRVTLNLDLVPGGPYELGLRDTMNLYRNSTGAVYPYNDANGMVSIIGNNAPNSATYYYFFYDWEVREQDCVSERTPVTFTILPLPAISGNVTNVSCNGLNDGVIAVTATGSSPFNYQWNNGVNASALNALTAGNYSLSVNDVYGCSSTASFSVSEPNLLSVVALPAPDTCNLSVGNILLSTTGGTAPYGFNWSNGATTSSIQSLTAGAYSVTITDSHHCSAIANAVVNNEGTISISTATTDVLCHGETTGVAAVSVNIGNAPYTFIWNNGQTTNTLNNIPAGTYTVSVTDALGCSAVSSVIINEPTPLSVSVAYEEPTCNGMNNGTANVIASGGTAAYHYQWNTTEVTDTIKTLSAGTYQVTVTDGNGCTATASATLNEPTGLSMSVLNSNVSCFGGMNGGAFANVSGGSPPYNYQWSNGASIETITALTAGNYSVTVTDNHNCSLVDVVTISEPDEIQFTTSSSNTLAGQNTGSISLTGVTGGVSPYTYAWSNGGTQNNILNLSAGVYSVTVTDANGCYKTTTVVITEIPSTGISETEKEISFRIYPNPATDKITIYSEKEVVNCTFNLRNAIGQLILTRQVNGAKQSVDVLNLPNGVYTVELVSEQRKLLKQLVIKR